LLRKLQQKHQLKKPPLPKLMLKLLKSMLTLKQPLKLKHKLKLRQKLKPKQKLKLRLPSNNQPRKAQQRKRLPTPQISTKLPLFLPLPKPSFHKRKNGPR